MSGAPVATNPKAGRDGVRPQWRYHAAGPTCRDDIYDQISMVLGPLAVRCRGWPVRAVRPLLARTWRDRFGGDLNPAALDGTACALAGGRHWSETLWSGGR